MTRYLIADLLTGRRILDLPVISGPWDDRLHVAETLSVVADLNDVDVQALDLDNSASVAHSVLAVIENQTVMAAGPIWTRNYDRAARTMKLNASGMASLFDHRLILPLLAQTIGTDQWTVPDPADATKTIPNPLLSTVYNGISLGTMAKRLVQQARTWTGGNVPIVFQADEADSRTETYLGSDFKPVWEAITDFMNRDDGIEVNFLPRLTSDGQGLEWLLQTGTVAQPLITSPSQVFWDVTVPESPVSNLTIAEDGSKMGSIGWVPGGGQNDVVEVGRSYDPSLLASNYPLLDVLDSSHSDASVPATLNSYATNLTVAGRGPSEVWSFTVEAYPVDEDGKPAGPTVGDYAVGDFLVLYFAPWDPVNNIGDPLKKAGGEFIMRIIGLSGDEKGEQIKVSCAPEVS